MKSVCLLTFICTHVQSTFYPPLLKYTSGIVLKLKTSFSICYNQKRLCRQSAVVRSFLQQKISLLSVGGLKKNIFDHATVVYKDSGKRLKAVLYPNSHFNLNCALTMIYSFIYRCTPSNPRLILECIHGCVFPEILPGYRHLASNPRK